MMLIMINDMHNKLQRTVVHMFEIPIVCALVTVL